MKRAAELRQLSRDHHQALYAALRLRRAGDASEAADAVTTFLEFWRAHRARHFRIEEDVLLPGFVAAGGDATDPLVTRVLGDHVEIRARARGVAPDTPLEELHELGKRLTAHVRLEEDELFPLIEHTLAPDELIALGAELDRAET